MTRATLKHEIIRAAVAWERARAEKLAPNQYRDLEAEESVLAQAVRTYEADLLNDDTEKTA